MRNAVGQVTNRGLHATSWWRGRDSNPRPLGYEPNELPLLHPASCDGTSGASTGRTRGGLASQGIAPLVLSGAAVGHDRVRDGTGWVHHALGHGPARQTLPPAPPHSFRPTAALRRERDAMSMNRAFCPQP
jgi:hypothetical protein